MAQRLFVRRSQGVALTEIGDNFFQHASLIIEELRVAQEDIQQRLGLAGGTVNIGVGGSIARTLMPPVITQFRRQFPNVKIRIVEGQLVSMILNCARANWTLRSIPPTPAISTAS